MQYATNHGVMIIHGGVRVRVIHRVSSSLQARPFLYGGGGDGGDDDDDAVRMMVDPALGGQYDAGQLAAVAYAAKICIQNSPELRPKMSEVRSLYRNDFHKQSKLVFKSGGHARLASVV